MNNVKKIAILSLMIAVMTGFAYAKHHESRPDATLRLSTGGFALGIGVNWGSGTLTYRGKDYPVKVKGLSVGRVGATGFLVLGGVSNLSIFQVFTGIYTVRGAGPRGVTLA